MYYEFVETRSIIIFFIIILYYITLSFPSQNHATPSRVVDFLPQLLSIKWLNSMLLVIGKTKQIQINKQTNPVPFPTEFNSSADNQKGVKDVQTVCSIENQKDAIAIDFVQRYRPSVWSVCHGRTFSKFWTFELGLQK